MNTAVAQPPSTPSPAKALIERLKDLGLSQADVVRESGLSQSKVSRWFRGELPEGADDVLTLLDLEKRRRAYIAALPPMD